MVLLIIITLIIQLCSLAEYPIETGVPIHFIGSIAELKEFGAGFWFL